MSHPSFNNIKYLSILGDGNSKDLLIAWFLGHYRNTNFSSVERAVKMSSNLPFPQKIHFTRKKAILGVDEWINGLWQDSWGGKIYLLISKIIHSQQEDSSNN